MSVASFPIMRLVYKQLVTLGTAPNKYSPLASMAELFPRRTACIALYVNTVLTY